MRSIARVRAVFALAPPRRRVTVGVIGILICAAAMSGCSSDSPAPSRSTTVAVDTTPAPEAAAPSQPGTAQTGNDEGDVPSAVSTTETVGAQPSPATPGTAASPPPNAHPAAGTPFPGEGMTVAQVENLQQAVDGGHQPWRLDRVAVAKSFAQARFGWSNAQTSTGAAPNVIYLTNSDGTRVFVHLIQPATQGPHGIWTVDSGAWS
ncbi:hypothetical protein K7711_32740 [Nocardia sp. CA2R105]|uniref:hypothetical protein n=1 Tax=Nocardia coffeae TaxID=2873381 RepID=UPI001CA64E4D|nr:hypothetical protein [Nocardia coffeae]MBY8861283.1 hypothetical protein [Nocardia coffeae]